VPFFVCLLPFFFFFFPLMCLGPLHLGLPSLSFEQAGLTPCHRSLLERWMGRSVLPPCAGRGHQRSPRLHTRGKAELLPPADATKAIAVGLAHLPQAPFHSFPFAPFHPLLLSLCPLGSAGNRLPCFPRAQILPAQCLVPGRLSGQ